MSSSHNFWPGRSGPTKVGWGKIYARYSVVLFRERRAFMHRNVVRLGTPYFVLRIVLGRVMRVALVIYILGVHLDYGTADLTGLGVPSYSVSNLESFRHDVRLLQQADIIRKQHGLSGMIRLVLISLFYLRTMRALSVSAARRGL